MLSASVAAATTYVMPTDAELLEKADLVVVATAVSAALAGDADYTTDWSFEVSDLVKGAAPANTIAVRQLGGASLNGDIAMLPIGAAPLAEGEDFLLFLEQQDNGSYRVIDFALGAFWHVPEANLALRDLTTSIEVAGPGATGTERFHQPRRFDAFVSALKGHVAGEELAASYFAEAPSGLVGTTADFNLFRSVPGNLPTGCPVNAGSTVRWQEFDHGDPVLLFANQQGQPGVPGGGFSQIQQAIDTWNSVGGATTNLAYGGTTPKTATVEGTDGQNTIAFEDPNDFIPGSYTSNPNGTIMFTVVFFSCEVVHGYPSGVAHTLIETGTISQDGTGSFFFNATNFLEVITHEIGHSLGIDHSCGDVNTGVCSGVENQAIMRAQVHNDGRGNQLNSDDQAAVRALYGAGSGSGPAAPTNLTATPTSTTTIDLAWQDNAISEAGFAIEQRLPPSNEWRILGNVPAQTIAVEITGLEPATTSEFQVRAFSGGGFSEFSNTASATTFGQQAPCEPGAQTLCLLDDRFQVTAGWATPLGTSGEGQAIELTADTGYFWFFQSTNVEVVVKVLEFCADPFNSFWVFAGGLTDVAVTLTVVDTENGTTKIYNNPIETPFQPIQDTAAFATCP